MRYLPLLFVIVFCYGCKKDPLNAKDGQIVELFVDHYAVAGNQMLYVMPTKTPAGTYLEGFENRELGYTYIIKAEMYIPKDPPQDGPDRWYKFVRIVNKELYKGTESFEISLKNNSIFGSTLVLYLENQTFYYGSYILTPQNDAVKNQLEDVLALRSKFQTDREWANNVVLKATVTHDPANRFNGYLVSSVIVQ